MKIRRTFTLEEDLLKRLKEVSDKTFIPQAKIVDLALREKLDELEHSKKPK